MHLSCTSLPHTGVKAKLGTREPPAVLQNQSVTSVHLSHPLFSIWKNTELQIPLPHHRKLPAKYHHFSPILLTRPLKPMQKKQQISGPQTVNFFSIPFWKTPTFKRKNYRQQIVQPAINFTLHTTQRTWTMVSNFTSADRTISPTSFKLSKISTYLILERQRCHIWPVYLNSF